MRFLQHTRIVITIWQILFFNINTYAQGNSTYLAVGTYTNVNSEGIYLYRFNEETGKLTRLCSIKANNPSYLAISKNHQYLYAVSEGGNNNYNGASAYQIDKKNDSIIYLNSQAMPSNAK